MEFFNNEDEDLIISHTHPKVEEPDFFNKGYNSINEDSLEGSVNIEEQSIISVTETGFIDNYNEIEESKEENTPMNIATDIINEPISASEAYEKFIRDLIVFFREQPLLWNKNHPQNRDKIARARAMDEILIKCSHYPEADLDYIKTKLDTIKCTFRREYLKVQESKKSAKSPEDVFKPTLWYYNDMLFSVGADPEKDKEAVIEAVRDKPNFIWNREDTLYLIELLKNYPILYSESSWSKKLQAQKFADLKQVAKDLSEKTGKLYDFSEVSTKISRLKNQYWKEVKRLQKGLSPSLWCYNMLDFLRVGCKPRKLKKPRKVKRKFTKFRKMKQERISDCEESNDSDRSTSNEGTIRKSRRLSKKLKIKRNRNSDTYSEEETKNVLSNKASFDSSKDVFDVIGKHVVLKLKEMSHEQKKYAENLVNEILYHGMMENLRWDTKVIV